MMNHYESKAMAMLNRHDWDSIVNLMDKDLCETINDADSGNRLDEDYNRWLSVYLYCHEKKYNEEFEI